MKKIIHTTLIIIFITLCGCSYKVSNSDEKKVEYTEAKQEKMQGFIMTFDAENKASETNLVHYVDGNYSPTMTLTNQYDYENEYRLLFFLNYEQKNIVHQGNSVSYVDLNVGPNETKEIQITLKDIPKGKHDFLMLAVRDPKTPVKKYELRHGGSFLFRRTNIINENDARTTTDIQYEKIDTKNSSEYTPVMLSNNPNEKPSLVVTNISDLNKKYWLHWTYHNSSVKSYAVLGILDGKQVNLEKPFVTPNNKGIISYPLPLMSNIITDSKKSNLFFVTIENPFIDLEDKNGQKTLSPIFIEFSNLMTVEK